MEKLPPTEVWNTDAPVPPDTDSSDSAVRDLTTEWRTEHKKRSGQLADELIKDAPGASADERLVLRLAAHDGVLSEVLGEAQLQLGRRIESLVEFPEHLVTLARSLEKVTTCRNSLTRRVQDLLAAAGTLRNQRKLGNVRHLRAVA